MAIQISKLSNGSVKINYGKSEEFIDNATDVNTSKGGLDIVIRLNGLKRFITIPFKDLSLINGVAPPANIDDAIELLANKVFNFSGVTQEELSEAVSGMATLNYKGLAEADTVPAIPSIETPLFYQAVAGVTYTDFIDSTASAITIPEMVGEKYVINPRLVSSGGSWKGVWELVDAPAGINPRQEWSETVADYNRLDWVTYGGSSYMAIWKNGNIPMGTPVTDKVYWEETAKGVDLSTVATTENISQVYRDMYSPEGNNVLDSAFAKQTAEVEPSAPWTFASGNQSQQYLAPAKVVNIPTPIGNSAVEISHSRTADKVSDYQFKQSIIVPKKHRNNTVWSFGYLMKRESAAPRPIKGLLHQYFSNEDFTGVLTGTTSSPTITSEILGEWVFVMYENIVLPANTKSIQLIVRTTWEGATPIGTVSKLWITGITTNFASGTVKYASQNQDEIILETIKPLLPTTPPITLADSYELNNNQFKDALFNKQAIGSAILSAPWAMLTGGASTFVAPYRIIEINSPVGNRAIEVDVSKRSSDGFTSDNQPSQHMVIPANAVGRSTLWSFGFWVKRENAIGLTRGVVRYYTSEDELSLLSTSTLNGTITGEVLGDWVFVKFINLTLPPTAKSVKIAARSVWDTSKTTPLDTIYKIQLTGFVTNFMNGSILGYTRNTDERINDIAGGNIVLPKLFGKKWTSFGDSITAANQYQKWVVAKFGLVHYLRGIGGSGVSTGSQIAWVDASGLYITRPPDSQPAGSFEILSQAYQQQRIDTIPLDTDIITIMFGTNDTALPTGLITDAPGTNTFYGMYKQMLDRIYVRVPNAEKLLMTPIFRADEETTQQTFFEKRDAIFKIGQKYSLRVIDVGGKCGINKHNSTTYLSDGVHPYAIGHERMAVELINEFPKIYS